LNCAGIKESAIVSILMTSMKISLVVLVFFFSIIYAATDCSHRENFNHNFSPDTVFEGSKSIISFGTAMIACLWCFDGFADGNFLQEEMINPVRDLPRIVNVGMMLVTACYIVINIGYLTVLSKDSIVDTKAIAVQFGDTVSEMFVAGKAVFPTILALGVSLSTIGAINGSIMTGGRAFYAVARAGKFPSQLAWVNSRGAPWVALVAQASWSIVLLLLPGSSFSTLLDYFGPSSWLFYALTASSVILLRHREPFRERPFKVPFYPVPPILVITIALVIFGTSVASQPVFTLLAVGFVIISFPVHYVMKSYGSADHSRLENLEFGSDFDNSKLVPFAHIADEVDCQ
jgi:amino acid transporter